MIKIIRFNRRTLINSIKNINKEQINSMKVMKNGC